MFLYPALDRWIAVLRPKTPAPTITIGEDLSCRGISQLEIINQLMS